jgi:hypothetical protein
LTEEQRKLLEDQTKLLEEQKKLLGEQTTLLKTLSDWYDREHYTKMTVSITPANGTYEMGSTQDIKFVWTFTQEVSSVTFNGEPQEAKQGGSKEVKGITTTSIYEVKGVRSDGQNETATAKSTLSFLNRYYWGCAADPRPTSEVNQTFIKNLANNGYASSRTKTFTAKCLSGQYIWYAYPKRFGTAKPQMAPAGSTLYLPGGFEDPLTVSVTNSSKHEEEYYVYRSINPGINQIVKMT